MQMKLTKAQLTKMIRESVKQVLKEQETMGQGKSDAAGFELKKHGHVLSTISYIAEKTAGERPAGDEAKAHVSEVIRFVLQNHQGYNKRGIQKDLSDLAKQGLVELSPAWVNLTEKGLAAKQNM